MIYSIIQYLAIFSLMSSIEPLPFEKLSPAVQLSDKCANVYIIESQEPLNIFKIQRLDLICNMSVGAFEKFMSERSIKITTKKFKQKISLLKFSKFYRQLNDTAFRFSHRQELVPLYGYHHRPNDHIFIKDNWLDNDFNIVFAHEIFHALTWQNNLFQYWNRYDYDDIDEKMACEFTKYLNL